MEHLASHENQYADLFTTEIIVFVPKTERYTISTCLESKKTSTWNLCDKNFVNFTSAESFRKTKSFQRIVVLAEDKKQLQRLQNEVRI